MHMDLVNLDSSDCESSDSEDDQYLKITIQKTPQGYIINSDVFLSLHHWNTIVYLDDKTFQCFVCDEEIDFKELDDHLQDEQHISNLDENVPLKEFDLSIIRKLNENYHCGICNILIDEHKIEEHIIDPAHGDKCNFAINKVSDMSIAYSDTNDRTECYHFDAAAINNNNTKTSACNNNNDVNNTMSYTSNSYFTDHNYDYFTSHDNQSVASSDDYYDDFEYTEVETPVAGVSYANMASKPRVTEVPDFIEKDFGNKKVTVKFDSWHMIIYPKKNQYYCMACKEKDHKRFRGDHCETEEHLSNLDKCKIVEMYKEHFVRQVDNKWLHCGHCNYLQLENEMIDHIEAVHPTQNKNLTEETKPIIQTPKKVKNDDNILKVIDKHELKPIKVDLEKLGQVVDNVNTNKAEVQVKTKTLVVENKSTPSSSRSISQSKTGKQDENNLNLPNSRNDKNNLVTDLSKYASFYENETSKNISSNITANNNNTVQSFFNKAAENATLKQKSSDMIDIFGTMIINPFGYKICITTLSYNAICYENGCYYCGLCDMQIFYEQVLRMHVHELKHIQRLQVIPFIQVYDCHLVRAIRSILHCGVCNKPIRPQHIYLHNTSDSNHLLNLNKALGILTNAPIMQVPPPSLSKNALLTNVPTSSLAQSLLNKPVPSTITKSKINTAKCIEIPSNVTEIDESIQDTKVKETIQGATKTIIGLANSNLASLQKDTTPASPSKTTKPASPKTIKLDSPSKTVVPPFKASVSAMPIKTTVPKPIVPKPFASKLNTQEPLENETNVETEPFLIDFTEKEEKKIEQEWKVERHRKTSEPTTNKANKKEDLEDSFEEPAFDTDEYVYVKLNSSYFKITFSSYNSLVQFGTGDRHCFVCSIVVDEYDLKRHVESREHLENVRKHRFLDKYDDVQLLRQIFLKYHCGVCNVLITQSRLKAHLSWPTHLLLNENSHRIVKKIRKKEIKAGTKLFEVLTQKGDIYLNVKEPQVKITLHVEIIHSKDEKPKLNNYTKSNKIVIFKDCVLKISWGVINGIAVSKNGFKCVLCQCDIVMEQEIVGHVESQWHKKNFDKPIVSAHGTYPALLRKINEAVLNCLVCNTEVANNDYIITDHVKGKKHLKNYQMIRADSSSADTYADCDGDVITVQ